VTAAAQAVQRGPNGPFVYVVKPDRTVEQRSVRLGPVRDGLALIEQGLGAGERVVVDGQYKLTAGARVDLGPIKAAASACSGEEAAASPPRPCAVRRVLRARNS
jgi:multidrug efflux system membrane fusion protein